MFFLLSYTSLYSIVILTLIPSNYKIFLNKVSIASFGFILILSCLTILQFSCNEHYFQHIAVCKLDSSILNINFSFGFDGVSIFFFLLSNFLIFLCSISIFNTKLLKETLLILHTTSFFLLLIFSALDILIFYSAFEVILIPMFILIGLNGSRDRKIRAAYLFFFYALAGSLLMLAGIIYIYFVTGSFSLEYLLNIDFTIEEQCFIWLSFFFSFASKVPVFPFHIWLPEAHVEAPTIGSVILAGIMLKLGVYGFIRFSLTLLPQACLHFSPILYSLCTFGIIYTSLSAVRQTDLKRIIAYSSVAHMNLVTLGIFSFNTIGLEGSLLQSISHGFVSSSLFFLVGVLYERYHSRFLYYYGGLVQVMPLYAAVFFFFTVANISIPGTSSFIGEFLILIGIYKNNIFCSIISCIGVVLCGTYSLWLFNRIFFGNLKLLYSYKYFDLSIKELTILIPLLTLTFFMGLKPMFFSNLIHLSIISVSNVNLS